MKIENTAIYTIIICLLGLISILLYFGLEIQDKIDLYIILQSIMKNIVPLSLLLTVVGIICYGIYIGVMSAYRLI